MTPNLVLLTSAKRRGWPAVQAYNQQDLFEENQQTDIAWYERPELSASDKEKRLREAEKYLKFNKRSTESKSRFGPGRGRRKFFKSGGFSHNNGAGRRSHYHPRDELSNPSSMVPGGHLLGYNNYVPPMLSLPPPAPRGGGSVICFLCKNEGHKANACPSRNNK